MVFSILIPVYNVERYVKHCVESVLTQDFSDYEVILVNDGSTDSSASICRKLAQKDKRIKFFEKENEGLLQTRRYSIKSEIFGCDSRSACKIHNQALKVFFPKQEQHDMDILVLNYEYPPLGGGAAPVCRDLAFGMAQNGHRVTVVTMGYTGLPEHEISDGVEIYRMKCLREKEHSCMPWEQYSYILAAKRFLKRHLRECRYDVCHTHFVIPTGPIARWVKRRYGIPYVITAHGSDVEGYNEKTYMKFMHRLLRPAWRKIVKDAYAAAAPSEYLLKLMNREMTGGRYVLIPNGLDISKYQADRSLKEKCILLMGRMQASKNYQTVLKAVAGIPDTIWDGWTVDILGDGPYKAELEKLCTELKIERRVKFHGWIENGSVEQLDYLKRASVYISASHFENCPMSVLEAIAADCCPLLSDIEGHRQFFIEDSAADKYFFQADDDEELAGRLEDVISSFPRSNGVEGMDISAFENKRVTQMYIKMLESAAFFSSPA